MKDSAPDSLGVARKNPATVPVDLDAIGFFRTKVDARGADGKSVLPDYRHVTGREKAFQVGVGGIEPVFRIRECRLDADPAREFDLPGSCLPGRPVVAGPERRLELLDESPLVFIGLRGQAAGVHHNSTDAPVSADS